MKHARLMLIGMAIAGSAVAHAGELPGIDALDTGGAHIVLLGEVHDNPVHHQNQATAVALLAPSALVFEMLTPEQAATANGMDRGDAAAMAAALDWVHSSWPDFAMYHPIFLAAPQASIFGAAVGRDDLIAAMKSTAADVFGSGANSIGLTPLPPTQQAEREALQMEAHCGALPEDMLPGMVEAQRLRDARFAATTLDALEQSGGPVVVITGNGHARRDWGMPAYLSVAAPDVEVFSLGQVEEIAPPDGLYDAWLITPAAEREDPCAVFEKK